MDTYQTMIPFFPVYGTDSYPANVVTVTQVLEYKNSTWWLAEVTTSYQGEQENYEEYQVEQLKEPVFTELTQRTIAALETYNNVLAEARDQAMLDPSPALSTYINDLIAGKDEVREVYRNSRDELIAVNTIDGFYAWDYPEYDVPPPFL